jgi:hypothetical protein
VNVFIDKAFVAILESRAPVFAVPVAAMIAKFPVFVGAVVIPAWAGVIIDVTVSETIRPSVNGLCFIPAQQAKSASRGYARQHY